MRSNVLAIAFLVCNLSLSNGFSQEQTPSATPSLAAPVAHSPLSPQELIDLRIQMAESGYDLQKTPENFSTMVVGYEDMVSALCMPELHESLFHGANPTEPNCRRYLDKLLELFPDDPVGICARDGIDSQNCYDQFAYQQIDTYTFYDRNQPGQSSPLELDLKLAREKDRPQIEILAKKVNDAQLAFGQNKSAATRKILAQSLYQFLGLQCRIVRTAIEERPRAVVISRLSQHDGDKKKESVSDPLLGYIDDKLGGGSSPTPTPIPLPTELKVRVRYLTPECLNAIAQYGAIDTYLAAPICTREGSISPRCVRAKRIERKYTLEPSVRFKTGAGDAGGIVSF